jgi:hypothetical protein
MRGRKPDALALTPAEESRLREIARSGSLPWFQVRSARIILAIAAGERRQTLAARMECDAATLWRTDQRYRQGGLAELLTDHRKGRSGRPERISPPAAGAAR